MSYGDEIIAVNDPRFRRPKPDVPPTQPDGKDKDYLYAGFFAACRTGRIDYRGIAVWTCLMAYRGKNYAGQDAAWPSLRRLKAMTGLGIEKVKTGVSQLEALKIISSYKVKTPKGRFHLGYAFEERKKWHPDVLSPTPKILALADEADDFVDQAADEFDG